MPWASGSGKDFRDQVTTAIQVAKMARLDDSRCSLSSSNLRKIGAEVFGEVALDEVSYATCAPYGRHRGGASIRLRLEDPLLGDGLRDRVTAGQEHLCCLARTLQ